jgi:hypothetical protein
LPPRFSTEQTEYAQTTASSQSPVNWTHELHDMRGTASHPSGPFPYSGP